MRLYYSTVHLIFFSETLWNQVQGKYYSFIKTSYILETRGADIEPVDSSIQPQHVEISPGNTQTDIVMQSEAEINRIVDVSDKKLVENLLTVRSREPTVNKSGGLIPSWSYEKFQLSLKNISDPATVVSPEAELQSILEDILQSCSEDCQLDLIDCY